MKQFCRLLIFLSACIFFCENVSAQKKTYNGKVLSAADSLPIKANVLIFSDGKKEALEVETKVEFSFSVAKKLDSVIISADGYLQMVLNASELVDTDLIWYLQPLQMSNVTVKTSGNKPKISSNKITYGLTNNIAAKGNNVWNLLAQMPGVLVNDNQVSIAGKGVVRVSIDGRLVQLSEKELANYLKSWSTNQIEKVEIIQNPSASMDVQGNVGVINLVSKKQKDNGYQVDLQPTYKHTQYGGFDFAGNLTWKHNNWNGFVNTNLMRTRSKFGFRTEIFYPSYHWLLSDTGNYHLENNSVNFGIDNQLTSKSLIGIAVNLGRYIERGADYVRNPYFSPSGSIDSLFKTYATYHPINNTQSYNLHYEWKPDTSGKKLNLDATTFFQRRTDRSDYESYRLFNDADPVKKEISLQKNTGVQNIDIYTFLGDYLLPVSNGEWKFGSRINFIKTYVNAFYYDVNNDEPTFNRSLSSEFKYQENTQAIYTTYKHKWNRLDMELGLRGEWTQTSGYSVLTPGQDLHNDYFKLYPSLNLQWHQEGNKDLSLTIGRRINRPTFWTLNPYKTMLTSYSYHEGNPYLQPEFNTNFNLQYNYKGKWISEVYFSLLQDGFADITIADTLTNRILRTPKNFVSSQKYGITEMYNFSPFSWLTSNNTFSLYYTNSNSHLDYVNPQKGWGAYVSTNNSISINKARDMTGLVNFWYQFPETNLINRSTHYWALDLGYSMSLFSDRLSIAANAHDIFGKSAAGYYQSVRGLREKFSTLQLNRYFTLTAIIKLGNSKITAKEKIEDTESSQKRL